MQYILEHAFPFPNLTKNLRGKINIKLRQLACDIQIKANEPVVKMESKFSIHPCFLKAKEPVVHHSYPSLARHSSRTRP